MDTEVEEEDNEVSVADLPLPADNKVALDTDTSLPTSGQQHTEVDSETEESDDNDTLTSRHTHRAADTGSKDCHSEMAAGDSVDQTSRSSSVDPSDKPAAAASTDISDSLCHGDDTTEPIEI